MPEFDEVRTGEYVDRMDTDQKLDDVYKPYIDNILSNIDYSPNAILDVGTGPGVVPIILAERFPEAKIVGIDSSKYMVSYAKQKKKQQDLGLVDFELGDGQLLRFKDDSFDLVLCRGVFKMIPNKLLALREMYRVLKPNRCAFISDLRRDGMDEFEKTCRSMPDEEKEKVRKAIGRSLTIPEVKTLLDDSGLSRYAHIMIQGYRFLIKITKS